MCKVSSTISLPPRKVRCISSAAYWSRRSHHSARESGPRVWHLLAVVGLALIAGQVLPRTILDDALTAFRELSRQLTGWRAHPLSYVFAAYSCCWRTPTSLSEP